MLFKTKNKATIEKLNLCNLNQVEKEARELSVRKSSNDIKLLIYIANGKLERENDDEKTICQLISVKYLAESDNKKARRWLNKIDAYTRIGNPFEYPSRVQIPSTIESTTYYRYPNAKKGLKRLLDYDSKIIVNFEDHAFEAGSYESSKEGPFTDKNEKAHEFISESIRKINNCYCHDAQKWGQISSLESILSILKANANTK